MTSRAARRLQAAATVTIASRRATTTQFKQASIKVDEEWVKEMDGKGFKGQAVARRRQGVDRQVHQAMAAEPARRSPSTGRPPGATDAWAGRWLERLARLLAWAGGMMMTALTLMSVYSVVMRNLVGSPIQGDLGTGPDGLCDRDRRLSCRCASCAAVTSSWTSSPAGQRDAARQRGSMPSARCPDRTDDGAARLAHARRSHRGLCQPAKRR